MLSQLADTDIHFINSVHQGAILPFAPPSPHLFQIRSPAVILTSTVNYSEAPQTSITPRCWRCGAGRGAGGAENRKMQSCTTHSRVEETRLEGTSRSHHLSDQSSWIPYRNYELHGASTTCTLNFLLTTMEPPNDTNRSAPLVNKQNC